MRHCMNLYVYWHQKYKRIKLKLYLSIWYEQIFQIWPFVFQVLHEINIHTIPHLNALSSGYWNFHRWRPGDTFILRHALLKKSNFITYKGERTMSLLFRQSMINMTVTIWIAKLVRQVKRIKSTNKGIYSHGHSLMYGH